MTSKSTATVTAGKKRVATAAADGEPAAKRLKATAETKAQQKKQQEHKADEEEEDDNDNEAGEETLCDCENGHADGSACPKDAEDAADDTPKVIVIDVKTVLNWKTATYAALLRDFASRFKRQCTDDAESKAETVFASVESDQLSGISRLIAEKTGVAAEDDKSRGVVVDWKKKPFEGTKILIDLINAVNDIAEADTSSSYGFSSALSSAIATMAADLTGNAAAFAAYMDDDGDADDDADEGDEDGTREKDEDIAAAEDEEDEEDDDEGAGSGKLSKAAAALAAADDEEEEDEDD